MARYLSILAIVWTFAAFGWAEDAIAGNSAIARDGSEAPVTDWSEYAAPEFLVDSADLPNTDIADPADELDSSVVVEPNALPDEGKNPPILTQVASDGMDNDSSSTWPKGVDVHTVIEAKSGTTASGNFSPAAVKGTPFHIDSETGGVVVDDDEIETTFEIDGIPVLEQQPEDSDLFPPASPNDATYTEFMEEGGESSGYILPQDMDTSTEVDIRPLDPAEADEEGNPLPDSLDSLSKDTEFGMNEGKPFQQPEPEDPASFEAFIDSEGRRKQTARCR